MLRIYLLYSSHHTHLRTFCLKCRYFISTDLRPQGCLPSPSSSPGTQPLSFLVLLVLQWQTLNLLYNHQLTLQLKKSQQLWSRKAPVFESRAESCEQVPRLSSASWASCLLVLCALPRAREGALGTGVAHWAGCSWAAAITLLKDRISLFFFVFHSYVYITCIDGYFNDILNP